MCDTTTSPPVQLRRTSVGLTPEADKAVSELIAVIHRERDVRLSASEVLNEAALHMARAKGIKI